MLLLPVRLAANALEEATSLVPTFLPTYASLLSDPILGCPAEPKIEFSRRGSTEKEELEEAEILSSLLRFHSSLTKQKSEGEERGKSCLET